MKNNQLLVSVVTPVFNGSKYIEELIVSTLDQDYPYIEHIIIDDGSNDSGATLEVLRRYPHLRWWSRPNKGAYATINEGIAASAGDLVTVICADDKYASRNAISAAVKLFTDCNKCDVVYGETITIGEDGRVVDIEGPRGGPLWIFPYYPVAAHCSILVKREKIVNEALWFDESFPYIADFDWIMRMIQSGYHFKRLRKPVAMFRMHRLQRSGDISQARIDEFQRARQRYGEGIWLLRYLIRKWVTMTMLKNLFSRRGIFAGIKEVSARISGKSRFWRLIIS